MSVHATISPRPSRTAWALVLALLLLASLVLAACGGGGVVPIPGVQTRALSVDFSQRKAVAYSPFRSANRDTETITAAMILREFVSYPWVHLDVAGTAYSETDLVIVPKGPTGVPTGIFIEFVRGRAR